MMEVEFEGQSSLVVRSFVKVIAEDRSSRNALKQSPTQGISKSICEIVDTLLKLVDECNGPCKTPLFQEQIKSMCLRTNDNKYRDNTELEHILSSYNEVLTKLFEVVNWGRIIAMFAFLQTVLYNLPDNEDLDKKLIDCTASFTNKRLRHFILENGGWKGLLSFSSGSQHAYEDIQKSIMRSLGGLAGVAGIVAIFGLVFSRLR